MSIFNYLKPSPDVVFINSKQFIVQCGKVVAIFKCRKVIESVEKQWVKFIQCVKVMCALKRATHVDTKIDG
jgi:hypothetical protein